MMNTEWHQLYTTEHFNNLLLQNKLTPKPQNAEKFITVLRSVMENIKTKSKDSNDYTKHFYKTLQEPGILFTAFYNSVLVHVDNSEHSYGSSSFHGLRGAFNNTLIASARLFPLSKKNKISSTNQADVENDESPVGNEVVTHIAGWTLKRARSKHPHLTPLIEGLGTDVEIGGRYYVEVTDEFLICFRQLSKIVHKVFDEETFTAHSKDLPAVARDAVKTNYYIRSKFHQLLPQHDDAMITQLIHEITNAVVNSATNQYMIKSNKKPRKESHSHRVSVSLGDKAKRKADKGSEPSSSVKVSKKGKGKLTNDSNNLKDCMSCPSKSSN